MPHLVMDTLITHTIEVTIKASVIAERMPEWVATVITAKSRSEYVQGLLKFCHLHLTDYDTAHVQRNLNGDFHVVCRSAQANLRLPHSRGPSLAGVR
jgi:hypothetical protein